MTTYHAGLVVLVRNKSSVCRLGDGSYSWHTVNRHRHAKDGLVAFACGCFPVFLRGRWKVRVSYVWVSRACQEMSVAYL